MLLVDLGPAFAQNDCSVCCVTSWRCELGYHPYIVNKMEEGRSLLYRPKKVVSHTDVL